MYDLSAIAARALEAGHPVTVCPPATRPDFYPVHVRPAMRLIKAPAHHED